jgi:hypothetical protein
VHNIEAIDSDTFGRANRKFRRAYEYFGQMVSAPSFFEHPRAICRVRRALERLYHRDRVVAELINQRLSTK